MVAVVGTGGGGCCFETFPFEIGDIGDGGPLKPGDFDGGRSAVGGG